MRQKTLGLAASLLALTAGMASAESTVRFWYHFDNADNPMDELVSTFEEQNPEITVEAENIPWNSYYDNLYTSIIGGNAPDAAMVKMFAQPRLIEMGALEPIGDRIDSWEGKDDLQDNLLELTVAEDGSSYYLPVQYVVLYMYYRPDMFEELGLEVPQTCEEFREAANALTRDTDDDGQTDVYGFGFRGGKGGHDHWASFTLGREGADLTDNIESEAAVAGTQFVVDLFREDGVFPPSAPNDGFQETIGAFKAGKTAMTIHHIGSANGMVEALGDKVSAAPVPECGGGRWTAYGDESTAVMSSAEDKDAAWKWISFLSEAGNNALFNEATGQLPVTKTDRDEWSLHPKRFVEATAESLPFANLLPNRPETSDFVNTVWPVAMQRALTGEITAEEMNAEIAELYSE
ncbi:carbohydrate ABC transporter substrate-binding protein, CUT1 family [Tranquillimonas rosea]|uniref:Carbohydrate ABC transporter substrate-binding protein, CUT1 family n=1 Tax=Tranquillimonas rosea TaxID=641238 RepID=A0A1H9VQL3_9RHOB|nr:sugar ABC transporter substrate-binding protein [Tranquillimonas rosea]SES23882.1 carbohydrate ABC transporter substrate-binding protein, CUT1 family [Tranquillimonas rosea]